MMIKVDEDVCEYLRKQNSSTILGPLVATESNVQKGCPFTVRELKLPNYTDLLLNLHLI